MAAHCQHIHCIPKGSTVPAPKSKLTALALVAVSPLFLVACSGGKPSQQEVYDGLLKVYKAQPSFDEAKAIKFADCTAPKFYEQLSDKTLRAMADGEDGGTGDPADTAKVTEIATECAKVLL